MSDKGGTAARLIISQIQLVPRFAAVTAIATGIFVLLGWALDIELLTRVLPALVAMNPATAVAFMLAGLALWLLQEENGQVPSRRAAQVCASLVAMVGLLKLCSLLGGPDVRIDQWLFAAKLTPAAIGGAGSALPNRMAPNTALNFLMLGSALLLLDVKRWRNAYLFQFCTIIVALTASLAVIGYVFNSGSFYRVGHFIPMALHTALCFIMLSAGILSARPHHGIMAIYTSHGLGGIVARRLLPAAIMVPTCLGWLRLQGERAGLYGTEFGVALVVTLTIFVFLGLIGWTSEALEQSDIERKEAEAEIRSTEQRTRLIVNTAYDAYVAMNADGEITDWNHAAETVFGWSREEAVGQPMGQMIIPQQYREAHQRGLQHFLATGEGPALNKPFEITALRRDGHEFPIELAISPIRWGETYIFSAFLRDITERKEVEQELQRAKEAAEEASLAKSQFLANIGMPPVMRSR